MQKILISLLTLALTGCVSSLPQDDTPDSSEIPPMSPYGVIIMDETTPETVGSDAQTGFSQQDVQTYQVDPGTPLEASAAAVVDASNLDADGLYDLGRRYMEGDGLEKNEVMGLHYLTLSAELGKDEAKRVLGLVGLRKNAADTEALAQLEDAATTSVKAQMQLGFLYGNFAEPKLNNQARAIDLLAKAAGGGSADAALYLSKLQYQMGHKDEGLDALKRAVELGSKKAQADLAGRMKAQGRFAEAGQYYRQAALQGDPASMYEYANGLIIQRFKPTLSGFEHPAEIEALAWFQKAKSIGYQGAAEEVSNLRGVLPELARHGYTEEDLDRLIMPAATIEAAEE